MPKYEKEHTQPVYCLYRLKSLPISLSAERVSKRVVTILAWRLDSRPYFLLHVTFSPRTIR
jgi:hypothetical protein